MAEVDLWPIAVEGEDPVVLAEGMTRPILNNPRNNVVRIIDSLYVTRAATVLLGCTNCDVKPYYLLYASYGTETKRKVISGFG